MRAKQFIRKVYEAIGDGDMANAVVAEVIKLIGEGHTEVSPDVITTKVSAALGRPFMLKDLVSCNNSSPELQHYIDSINPSKIKFSTDILTVKNQDSVKTKEKARSGVASMASRAASRPRLGESYYKYSVKNPDGRGGVYHKAEPGYTDQTIAKDIAKAKRDNPQATIVATKDGKPFDWESCLTEGWGTGSDRVSLPDTPHTYYSGNGQLQKEYEELYDKLVPAQGAADTIEGEVLRAASKIVYRHYNDGDEFNQASFDQLEKYIGHVTSYDDLAHKATMFALAAEGEYHPNTGWDSLDVMEYGPEEDDDDGYDDYAEYPDEDDEDDEDFREGTLNEFAPGGDDGEQFNQKMAKMAYDQGLEKGVSLSDGATLERAMAMQHFDGVYTQYFAKGFKEGRLNKIKHQNKQYNLNLKLMKDGSIRHGEQKLAEGAADIYSITSERNGRERSQSGTLAELIEYYGYTLATGKSYEHERGRKKINLNPKSIESLVQNLNNAKSNAAANGQSSERFYLDHGNMAEGMEEFAKAQAAKRAAARKEKSQTKEGWESGPEERSSRERDPDAGYDAMRQEKADAEVQAQQAKRPQTKVYTLSGRGPNMEPNYKFPGEYSSQAEADAARTKLMANPKTPNPRDIGIRVQTKYLDEGSVTPLRDLEDYNAKRKALQDIQVDPDTAKDPELNLAVMRRLAGLEKQRSELK